MFYNRAPPQKSTGLLRLKIDCLFLQSNNNNKTIKMSVEKRIERISVEKRINLTYKCKRKKLCRKLLHDYF